ncbi:alpha-2-macroglobulin [Fundulus heteroclitus]|uniref:alpha-2-macroglobulin n=1 Tax=Fundulus heteroclitus TaxID=8078 RepID=UPI00165B403C|nr:alpha-2-macroglobulin [Fundulus heteroclitus]
MAKPGIQMWTLLALLFPAVVGQASATNSRTCPIHYLVSVPSILESGSKRSFCVSLSPPRSPVYMEVSLNSEHSRKTLLRKRTSNGFHKCILFRVPVVRADEVQVFEVQVKSQNFYSREFKKVLIKVFQPKTFIQTDKPIYNPGQSVVFRVVTLDTKLEPLYETYDSIVIKDPYNSRIAQWTNQGAEGSILQLSYLLGDEAPNGFYRITAQTGERKAFHSFKVQKYGLPKFDIVVTITKEISVRQETFEVKVCAKYPYGKPVDGDITLRVCRPLKNQNSCSAAVIHKDDRSVTSLCRTRQKQPCNKGCATFVFKVSSFTRPDPRPLLDVLDVSATVVERLTCVSHTQWERMKVTYLIGRLFFQNVHKTYTQGKNLVGEIKAVNYIGQHAPNLTVYVFAGKKDSPYIVDTVTTDHLGIASFSLNTRRFRGKIHLYASSTDNLDPPEYKVPYYEIGKFQVHESGPGLATRGFLKVVPSPRPLRCYHVEEITVEYSLEPRNPGPVDIVLLVLSRGRIVLLGHNSIHLYSSKNKGKLSFSVEVRSDFAPQIQVVVYTVLDCERVLAHSALFHTQDCFRNPVSSKFSPSPVTPGEDVKLCIKARPDSVCGVSLIDLNVLVRSDDRNLNADQIYGYLPMKKSYPIPPELREAAECVKVKPRTSVFAFTNQEREDANTVFSYQGLHLLTNLVVQNPTCLKMGGKKYYEAVFTKNNPPRGPERKALDGTRIPDPGSIPYTCHEQLEPVHKLSTETWLFDLVKVGEQGKTCVPYTVPEVITTWNAEVFCVSPHGFGLARPVLLTVYRPFLLDFKLPDYLILGESVELKLVIYNNLPTSLKIKITTAASSRYTLTPVSTDQCLFCLCGGEHKIIRWFLTPTSLGEVDVSLKAEAVSSTTACCNQDVRVPEKGQRIVVTRTLKVKAMGHEIIKTYSWLLCPKGGYLSEKIEPQIPQKVIGGTLKATVSVSGDFLSRSLRNLGDLLHLPYGGGEQNIAFMAINTYILHYLRKTNQLCQETEKRGLNYLNIGYQRQLTYKDKTCAFITFDSGEVNTWLTAFVMVTFYKAQSFIYVDPKIIEEARKWLECQQLDDGCFKMTGKLYNNKMRGDVPDAVTLSAYVTAALLETNIPANNPVVKKSLECLKKYIHGYSNTYTTALLAYVFTLAQDWDVRSKLLLYLDSVAIREGDLQHWCPSSNKKASPVCVEISAYVLLARFTGSVSEENLSCSSSIIRWLVKQQSHYGGFYSTQDTTVAIKAMTLYSTTVMNRGGTTSVTVTSPIDHLSFQVTQQNKLVYQELILQDLKGGYWLKAEGTSCTAVQVAFLYNVPASAVVSSFSMEVDVLIHSCCNERLVTLKFKSLYMGHRSYTNMVVLDIEIPSGFAPLPESLWNLKKGALVSNVEYKNGHVYAYLRELHKDIAVFHELELIQEYEVQQLKQSTASIYDYYYPSDKGVTEYCGKYCNNRINSHTHDHYHLDHKSHHHEHLNQKRYHHEHLDQKRHHHEHLDQKRHHHDHLDHKSHHHNHFDHKSHHPDHKSHHDHHPDHKSHHDHHPDHKSHHHEDLDHKSHHHDHLDHKSHHDHHPTTRATMTTIPTTRATMTTTMTTRATITTTSTTRATITTTRATIPTTRATMTTTMTTRATP